MLQQDKPDDYVVATGETHTVREFLEKTFEIAGLNVEEHVRINPRFFRPHEVPLLLGDPSKARKALGWEPRVNFEQLVEMMYAEDFARAQLAGYQHTFQPSWDAAGRLLELPRYYHSSEF